MRPVVAVSVAYGLATATAQERPATNDPAVVALLQVLVDLSASDAVASPDQPAWADLLSDVDDLVDSLTAAGLQGPAWPEALRLRGEAYAAVGWWSRSLDAWERLRVVEASWTAWDAARWSDVVRKAGYARYEAGDPEGAVGYFTALTDADPADVEAWRWRARIALERGADDAVELWERVVALAPGDEGAVFHATLARERARHGTEASDRFREGLAAHQAGDLDLATTSFELAAMAAPSWIDPVRWWARTLLERGLAAESVSLWERAVGLDPRDAGLAWWLERARLEAQVGPVAAAAADDARRLAAAGNDAAAEQAWATALAAAPTWGVARLGHARALLAVGDAAGALQAWTTILDEADDDDPVRAEARASIELATLLAALDREAAAAVAAALREYERGDVAAARVALVDVVTRWPDATLAWTWLGNVSFAERDYVTAATAYLTASLLDPSDEDVAFFAEEARRLAAARPPAQAP